MSELGGLANYRMSTDSLPERDRVGYWREFFGRTIMRLEMEPAAGEPLHFEIAHRSLDRVAVATARVSGYRCRRTPDLLDDNRNSKILLIPGDRSLIARQRGREVVVGKDEALLFTMDEVLDVQMPGTGRPAQPARHAHVILPHEVLAPMVPDLDDLMPNIIPANNEALRLLRDYLGMLSGNCEAVTARTAYSVAGHILDLTVLALGGSGEARAMARKRGLGAARLAAVQALVQARLSDPGLSLAEVARHSGISPGYVRKLFAGQGTSFSGYVLERRLERAWGMLSSRAFADHRVSDITYDCGFGDLSYFNRTFRRRYGMTPSDARALGRAGDSELQ